MLKNTKTNGLYDFSRHSLVGINPSLCLNGGTTTPTPEEEAIYNSDEFRMFSFKIKRCTQMRSHDWTECPFAHRGEKARRRDPRKFNYAAVACPDFRSGDCRKGEICDYAHGVFEYWLHPAKYRTRACNAGRFCQRKVCFFAHTPEQLRCDNKYKCHFMYKARMEGSNGGGGGGRVGVIGIGIGSKGGESTSSAGLGYEWMMDGSSVEGESDFLKRLRELKIRDGDGVEGELRGLGGVDISDSDLPHIEWISELLA
ncbi:hypothetical protein L1049_020148 [Liquidambar formosana]|uniref:C3H1-type domain-containing protein n=1 Tax=Liquidambar formosana TaxID=63359 RepID=A0AAP0S6R0_LIQFO